VITAITLWETPSGRNITRHESTEVEFRELSDDEIWHYIHTKNPLDKAGSYGIQDFVDETTVLAPPPESFVKAIVGDYYNVMGLSQKLLLDMMDEFDMSVVK
jgi:septum formation protein